jgi:hypothetical protein
MSNLAFRRPSVNPSRAVAWVSRPRPLHPQGVLHVTEEVRKGLPQRDLYVVRLVPAAFGHGFHVRKLGPPDSAYRVNLSADGHHTCECKGHLRWGHCRHVEALLSLLTEGGAA